MVTSSCGVLGPLKSSSVVIIGAVLRLERQSGRLVLVLASLVPFHVLGMESFRLVTTALATSSPHWGNRQSIFVAGVDTWG
jgi:hypothetical protein